MSSNADTIAKLEGAKDKLQAQSNAASGAMVLQLMTQVHQVADEISATEAKALADADYVPSTDAFKANTDQAKAFVAGLNSVKSAFAGVAEVAAAVDTIIGIVA
jgi:hypothetical protein